MIGNGLNVCWGAVVTSKMLSKPTILIAEAENFSPMAVKQLRQVGDVVMADLDRPGLLAAVSEVDVLWVRLRHYIDAEVFDNASHLKFIVSPTTGLNHIDLKYAQQQAVQVLSLRGEDVFLRDVRATAEHTINLLLTLLRHTVGAVAHVNVGGWDRDKFKGGELYGKTIGVVGYGRLGRIVARYLRAFDAHVITTDPYCSPHEIDAGIHLLPLRDLLAQAEMVTLHVNLNSTTDKFFGREQFAAMRNGAWFVNTARGELVDEDALLESLISGKLAGAALDVLSNERSDGMGHHPLVVYAHQSHNLIITPHIGGCTIESMERTERFMVEKLCWALERT